MTRKREKWSLDNRVKVKIDGEFWDGAIVEFVGKTKAKVLFDDGDVRDILLGRLRKEKKFVSEGFNQYNIHWDKDKINFKFKAEGGEFYGWWRLVKVEGGPSLFAIDIHAKHEDKCCSVETLSYCAGKNPQEDINSLNADICASVNKWLYQKVEGKFETITQLYQKAEKPVIHIRSLGALDEIINRLMEYREVALSTGGIRIMTFTGELEDDPSMRIEMSLFKQALAFKGRVPKLTEGATLDRVAEDSGRKIKGRGKPTERTSDQSSIDSLLKELEKCNDPRKKRKLRQVLRKLGHKGGARAKETPAKKEELKSKRSKKVKSKRSKKFKSKRK